MEKIDKVESFREIAEEMVETFERKNKDYGDSFGISINKYGPIAALTRMSDKFNRVENLIMTGTENRAVSESLADTLLDLACYSIMTIIELDLCEKS